MPKISLRAARVNVGLTQPEAAERLGITKETLINWELGRSEPKASQIDKIIELYGIPYEGLSFLSFKT